MRIAFGLLSASALFLIIRTLDSEHLGAWISSSVESSVAESVRIVLAYFAASTIGAVIARRGILMPLLAVVTTTILVGIRMTYMSAQESNTLIQLSQFDWVVPLMAILSCVIGVKTGEWIVASAKNRNQANRQIR